jgi:hypothetical protein
VLAELFRLEQGAVEVEIVWLGLSTQLVAVVVAVITQVNFLVTLVGLEAHLVQIQEIIAKQFLVKEILEATPQLAGR